MKALSLTQPWATLVAIGAKKIETRSWGTKYRGPLAIHAAQKFPGWAYETCFRSPFVEVLSQAGLTVPELVAAELVLPRGKIIAVCNLSDCVEIMPENIPGEPERSFGNYEPGRFAWHLTGVRAIEPVAVTGNRRLWNVDPQLLGLPVVAP